MSNRKITQLTINNNPTLSDVFPIVNSGVTKQLSLTGLTSFIAPYIDTVNPIFTGGTVSGATRFTNGLTANTISATTYQNLPIDVRVTGGTYSNETIVFTNNTGGTFNVSGFSDSPISISGTTLYSTNPATSDFSLDNNIFFGSTAGNNATNVSQSNFLGSNAGQNATNASYSNFIGAAAGNDATSANNSNFIGESAGQQATGANNSNFIGRRTGQFALNAAYSTFIGYNVGASWNDNDLSTNNIIIGTNISLPNNTYDGINLGGILFGTGTYSDSNGNPSIIAQSTGKIGVGVVTPTANLEIAASTTESALMKLNVGPAPSSPNDGDIWLEDLTLTGLKIRISGVTRTINIT